MPHPAAVDCVSGVNEPGAENPLARRPGEPGPLGTPKLWGFIPTADLGGGMGGTSTFASRLRGFGRRGGTRRLKLATTSAGEWRLRVGWAL